jgi:hypothetical protein
MGYQYFAIFVRIRNILQYVEPYPDVERLKNRSRKVTLILGSHPTALIRSEG